VACASFTFADTDQQIDVAAEPLKASFKSSRIGLAQFVIQVILSTPLNGEDGNDGVG
jgi:hypothetical protein